MPSTTVATQIAFRYRNIDSPTGVTRETSKRVAERLGVDETQALHIAMYQLAVKVLPQYQPDDGALSATQLRQIKKAAPTAGSKRSIRSSLFDSATA